MSVPAVLVDRHSLVRREPFISLFPCDPAVVHAITESMRTERGFDPACPIRIWKEENKNTVLDGHIRLKAAEGANIDTVPILIMEFVDERTALEWVFTEQVERRRNLTKEEARVFLVRAIRVLDTIKPRGGDHKSATAKSKTAFAVFDRGSAHITAQLVGTSPDMVDRVRAVEKHGDEPTKEAMRSGHISPWTANERVRRAARGKPKTARPISSAETTRFMTAQPALARYLETQPPNVAARVSTSWAKARTNATQSARAGYRTIWDLADKVSPEVFVRLLAASGNGPLHNCVKLWRTWPIEMLENPAALKPASYNGTAPRPSTFYPGVARHMDDRIIREHRELDHAVLARLATVPVSDQGLFFTAQVAGDQTWIEQFEMPTWRKPFWPWDEDAQDCWKAIVFIMREMRSMNPRGTEVSRGINLQQWSGRLYKRGPTRWCSAFFLTGAYLEKGNVIDWWRPPHEQDGTIGPEPPDWISRLND